MLCSKQMQQTSAANQLDSILPVLTLAQSRASYSQTCSDTNFLWHPGSEETGTPRILVPGTSPLEYGTVGIEQISFYCYKYGYKDTWITSTRRLYACSK
jgi:hypothetical protein